MENIFTTSGSALMDVVLGGGFGPYGKVINLIGDSSTGKTLLTVEAIFHAKKKFKDNLKIRYNDCESGFNFDTTEMYGYDIRPHVMRTPNIEAFSTDLLRFCGECKKEKKFGIYVVDSWDGLASDADLEEFEERLKAEDKGKEYDKGSYGMDKQKYSSKLFRTLSGEVESSNVMLIIISQIRDKIGVSFGEKWTISGGNALKFYSTVRLFLKTCEIFKVQDRPIGYCVDVYGMKTRSKYPFRHAKVNLTFKYGVDDVSTNIDYLYDLKEDYGKLKDEATLKNISFREDAVEVNSTSLKEFLDGLGKLEEATTWIKDNTNGRMAQNNLLLYIKDDPEVMKAYIEHFGVIDRDGLIDYVVTNDLEEEFAKRAVEKWMKIEKAIEPIRKSKTL